MVGIRRMFRKSTVVARRLVRSQNANTAEENSNRGMWWLIGIVVVATVAGVVWYEVGNVAVSGQQGGINVVNQVSTQSGLDQLTNQVETNGGQFGIKQPSAGGFTAP